MDPLPRFGRYEALFRIAAGGMAEVFAARIRGEAGFEKLVAVKRMLPHLAEDEGFVDMFLDEARVAVQVSSPHCVQTLDLGRADDGALYIVMELVVGAALSTLIRDLRRKGTRIPTPIAIELIAQAAQGLDDAHEATTPTGIQLGLVHRDVSPHNVLVGVDGRARVTDFGIARAMMRRTATATGELKGKFAYFSPEQASGQTVDRRADIFALGIVAWETLLGRRLFSAEDPLQILNLVKDSPIPLVHEIDEQIPRAVSHAIARALTRPIDRRYATAADFAHALREAGRTLGPAPTQREIGRWVNEAGGETLQRMRSLIDQALSGDDVVTVARSSPRTSQPSVRSTPKATLETLPSSFVTIEHSEPSTVAATTATATGTTVVSMRPSRAPLVIGAVLVLGAALAIATYSFVLPKPAPAAAAPSEIAPLAIPTPSASPIAPSHADAAAPEPSVVAAKPASKVIKPTPTHKATVTVTATTTKPIATHEPPPPPPPTATATATTTAPKKTTGPILGDDAFDKK